MQSALQRRRAAKSGGVLVTTVVITAVAAAGLGSVMHMLMNHRQMAQRSYARDRAFYLAEAGLAAGIAKLNGYSDASIPFNQSTNYFQSASSFEASDWGFQTVLQASTNGGDMIVSTGRFGGQTAQVSAQVALSAGERSIHALYAHALYAGNSSGDTNYCLRIGGSGSGADFVMGDTYSGYDLDLSGDAYLRLPELLDDLDGDGVCAQDEDWESALVSHDFETPLTQAEYDAYVASMAIYEDELYKNGIYDFGEAYVDTIGDGIYQEGEPFTDQDGDGVRHPGDDYTDVNGNSMWDEGEPFADHGNGVWDGGEEWIEDSEHRKKNKSNGSQLRLNGKYDPAGGYWQYDSRRTRWRWKTASWTSDWPAEDFEDQGDGIYYAGEPWVDGNGVYDEGEEFFDDRNELYDYGTQAKGNISGMPSPGPGQQAATGHNVAVDPPDLTHMYYPLGKNGVPPFNALTRWGNDVAVTSSDYSDNGMVINSAGSPEHIFVRNPPTGGSVTRGGERVYGRSYDTVYDDNGQRVDDYFLEDPTDSTFNSIPGESYAIAKNDNNRTHTMMIDIRPADNLKLYYVDGNVYIHNPKVYAMRFREPGTRVTIVAKGNITISDEFYYNADYDSDLQYSEMDSTVVNNPQDALCLIALKNPNCTSDSGNIYIGDRQFGTGGSIHAMLYAENDFVDNNINTSDQQFISVFGNMTAGNQVRLNRDTGSGRYRTRLDVTLDERIRRGTVIVPGLPHSVGYQRCIVLDSGWSFKPGTWQCAARF